MSGASYPSPVSSAPSPTIDNNMAPAARVMPDTLARNHTDTHRSIHQASAALEAAYHRIRQVRRSLLELSDTLSVPESQARISEQNDIGPGHESIVLTGALMDDSAGLEDGDPEVLRDAAPSSIVEGLRRRELRLETDMLGAERTSRWRDQNITSSSAPTPSRRVSSQTSSLNSSVSPIRRHPLPPRRSLLETQLSRRRDIHPDDPATALGRRVAAREAAGSPNGPMLPRWDGNPSRLFATIERDIEHIRFATRQRRTEPPRLEPLMENGWPTGAEIRASRSLDANTFQPHVQSIHPSVPAVSSSQTPLGSSAEQRRRRGIRVETRPPSSQSLVSNPSDRLSLLSNLSVQNLATPVSAISQPLLFAEPYSYVPAANFPEELLDFSDEPVEDGGSNEERNYVIRRRMNADGEEHIHPINLEWSDEDTSSWLLPRGLPDDTLLDYLNSSRPPRAPLRYHQRNDTIQASRTPNTMASPPEVVQRRRGWARLDADGNDIPSDEEEELERTRAEYRVRALSRSRAVAPIDGLRPRTHSLMPVTSTSILTDDDPSLSSSNLPRVRLHAHNPRLFYGSVMDSVVTVDSLRSGIPQPSQLLHTNPSTLTAPFCADPLPMPVEDMMNPASKASHNVRTRAIRVPRDASFAGR